MRVLMIARSTVYSSPGGDTTQIIMTARYLTNLGVAVEIKLSDEKIDFRGIDLVHFFNIIRPDDILSHLPVVKVPFVISTIFVEYHEYEKSRPDGITSWASNIFDRDQLEYLKTIARLFKNGDKIKSFSYLIKGQKASILYIARKASILLPNSDSEYKRFSKSYSVKQRYRKIVNAIDASLFKNDVVPDQKYIDHILCVGRIEGRKNQLNLIKAVIATGLSLTIVGKASPNHKQYFQDCKDLASKSSNITFIDQIDHEDLAAIYKAAKVHVLPSWFETTGLSSLEAGAMGCNLVITRKGDTEEYFGDMAYYCEPDNIASIRKAVLQAYHEPVNPKLQNYIMTHYTWEITARQTLDAYKEALSKK